MKGLLSVFVFTVFFVTAKGQCPSIVENSLIASCDGSRKDGPTVYADFFRIKRPCNCIVTPSFVGKLLVISKKVTIKLCDTRVSVSPVIKFGCPLPSFSSHTLNVQINKTVNIQAEYIPPSTTGTFYHCIGFQQNGGLNGNLSVKCEPPSNTTTSTVSLTISTTTSTNPQLSHEVFSTESSIAVVNANNSADINISLKTTTANYYPLPVESAQNTSEITIYIIAGSAAGGALIIVCLIIITIILINRSRSERNKNRSLEANMSHTNEVFDINTELPDNPLYLSSQPVDELGYSSDQEKQLGLPPTDSKSETKIISHYDVPPNNKPIDNNESSIPVYAVPKKSKVRAPAVSTGDVYAHVCKSNRSTAQISVRNHEN
uniref:Uncharacterized protein n=1 Tax=Magallana gigas TaxID=29159 RepID=A0A8W8JGC7_MAGGI